MDKTENEEIKKWANNWTLKHDVKLLEKLQFLGENLLNQSEETYKNVQNLNNKILNESTKIKNLINEFNLIGHKQFIENRVKNEFLQINQSENLNDNVNTEKKLNEDIYQENIKRYLKSSLDFVENNFENVNLLLENVSEFNYEIKKIKYEEYLLNIIKKNKYISKKLPSLINSHELDNQDFIEKLLPSFPQFSNLNNMQNLFDLDNKVNDIENENALQNLINTKGNSRLNYLNNNDNFVSNIDFVEEKINISFKPNQNDDLKMLDESQNCIPKEKLVKKIEKLYEEQPKVDLTINKSQPILFDENDSDEDLFKNLNVKNYEKYSWHVNSQTSSVKNKENEQNKVEEESLKNKKNFNNFNNLFSDSKDDEKMFPKNKLNQTNIDQNLNKELEIDKKLIQSKLNVKTSFKNELENLFSKNKNTTPKIEKKIENIENEIVDIKDKVFSKLNPKEKILPKPLLINNKKCDISTESNEFLFNLATNLLDNQALKSKIKINKARKKTKIFKPKDLSKNELDEGDLVKEKKAFNKENITTAIETNIQSDLNEKKENETKSNEKSIIKKNLDLLFSSDSDDEYLFKPKSNTVDDNEQLNKEKCLNDKLKSLFSNLDDEDDDDDFDALFKPKTEAKEEGKTKLKLTLKKNLLDEDDNSDEDLFLKK